MEFRFEPCVLNFIWEWGAKDPQKRKDHLIFINFGVKKFMPPPKKIKIVFENHSLLYPMQWELVSLWGWFLTRYLEDPILASFSSDTLIS
jgi:hypothetical protein